MAKLIQLYSRINLSSPHINAHNEWIRLGKGGVHNRTTALYC